MLVVTKVELISGVQDNVPCTNMSSVKDLYMHRIHGSEPLSKLREKCIWLLEKTEFIISQF